MDWKNHPVIVALSAGAVTLAFCVTTVLPVWTKVLENKVDEYRKEISALKDDIKASNDKVSYFEKRNSALGWDGIISSSTPYPKGFNGVVIGDPISRVSEVFKGAQIDTKKYWLIVTFPENSEAIRAAAYYFDEASKVSHILFFFSNSDKSLSPLEDVNGKLGAVGDVVFTTLKSIYPNAKTSCTDDDGHLNCSILAPKYKFGVTSSSYHVTPRS